MKKSIRKEVHEKFDGHCAYCGKTILYEDMQVDHYIPKRSREFCLDYSGKDDPINNITNLMPACRRCNHYKRSYSVEDFRKLIRTLHERIMKTYIAKVALDYGIITVNPHSGVFFFEKSE